MSTPKAVDLPKESSTEEEHHEWACKLWNRIDRNRTGILSQDDLNCEEFKTVIQDAMNPQGAGSIRGSYSRPEINIDQALGFLLRKADGNKDGYLSFEEFEHFLRVLRNCRDPKYTANLIFAFFDTDGTLTIDPQKFSGIYRFYTGHGPTANVLKAHWAKLDPENTGQVTREQYIKWLQESADPIFRQHASPVIDADGKINDEKDEDSVLEAEIGAQKLLRGLRHRPNPAMLPMLRRLVKEDRRPQWNSRLNPVDVATVNPMESKRRKTYFSGYQSLPDLTRHYEKRAGFEAQMKRLRTPEAPSRPLVLSTDSRAMPEIIPDRASPQGSMKSCRGQVVQWNDTWQTPGPMKPTRRDPGSLMLRTPGPPPEWIRHGKDAERIMKAKLKSMENLHAQHS
eukprot:TRINITY_DN351_c1_g1_i1.p1 TRINITY_DN351_c1_g1~~TRINITY_DN351_c1_g1_i1.p1  ORF type:complete len:397 (-),score=50.74 TRINITY_DN351_c1_g1_i1:93-1283(-)